MDNVYLIHLDDYVRHIDDKLTLYAMLRQLEDAIGKMPECKAADDVRSRMAAFSPKIKEMWAGWNIPVRYLVSGEVDDLNDIMEDELIEPEDAGYFNDGGDDNDGSDARPAPTLADHQLLMALLDAADHIYDDYTELMGLARDQLRRCDQ